MIEARRVERAEAVALDFGKGAGDRFVGRLMHFRIHRKRIVRFGGIEILEEELGQEMRLVHLVNASAEAKQFGRQLAKANARRALPSVAPASSHPPPRQWPLRSNLRAFVALLSAS